MGSVETVLPPADEPLISRKRVHELTPPETARLQDMVASRHVPKRISERASIILESAKGLTPGKVAKRMGVHRVTANRWSDRFDGSTESLEDKPRSGRPPTYKQEQCQEILAIYQQDPTGLGLPFQAWTWRKFRDYLREHGHSEIGTETGRRIIFESLKK